jgi:hypothetical protein
MRVRTWLGITATTARTATTLPIPRGRRLRETTEPRGLTPARLQADYPHQGPQPAAATGSWGSTATVGADPWKRSATVIEVAARSRGRTPRQRTRPLARRLAATSGGRGLLAVRRRAPAGASLPRCPSNFHDHDNDHAPTVFDPVRIPRPEATRTQPTAGRRCRSLRGCRYLRGCRCRPLRVVRTAIFARPLHPSVPTHAFDLARLIEVAPWSSERPVCSFDHSGALREDACNGRRPWGGCDGWDAEAGHRMGAYARSQPARQARLCEQREHWGSGVGIPRRDPPRSGGAASYGEANGGLQQEIPQGGGWGWHGRLASNLSGR